MIIGISGKIGSGKDTVAKIIQYLFYDKMMKEKKNRGYYYYPTDVFIEELKTNEHIFDDGEGYWEVKKFAYKLKQICSLLTGIPVEDFEKETVKQIKLGDEWIRYGYARGFTKDNLGNTTMLTEDCDKERYEQEVITNWQTAYKVEYTVRLLLQRVGTEAMRQMIHPNVWVNALFADYKPHSYNSKHIAGKDIYSVTEEDEVLATAETPTPYPNWIITDVRFPNEAQAIKDRKGFLIRVNRPGTQVGTHASETALDDYKSWDAVIDNYGTMDNLIDKVRTVVDVLGLLKS